MKVFNPKNKTINYFIKKLVIESWWRTYHARGMYGRIINL